MSDGVSLSHLHDVPYSNIEGAYVKVKQEVTDHMAAPVGEVERSTEEREGRIIGRGNGRGVVWDRGEKANKTVSIGPSIYLDTPEDTILEVRTDKLENELLAFEPESDE